jgi:hypothetical protein
VVPETPASPSVDVVAATPALLPPAHPADPVLTRMIRANAEGLRKRRLNYGLSPEFQVSQPPPKHRLLNAVLDISTLFGSYQFLIPLRSSTYFKSFLFRLNDREDVELHRAGRQVEAPSFPQLARRR